MPLSALAHVLGTFEDSKTLAKLANKAAKKKSHLNGVCVWDTVTFEDRESLLARLPVVEIWGVGSRLTRRLNAIGYWSMMDLRDADAVMIRNRFLVLLMRTVFELRGIPCTAAQSPPAGTGVGRLGHDEPFQRQLVTQPSRFGGAAGADFGSVVVDPCVQGVVAADPGWGEVCQGWCCGDRLVAGGCTSNV